MKSSLAVCPDSLWEKLRLPPPGWSRGNSWRFHSCGSEDPGFGVFRVLERRKVDWCRLILLCMRDPIPLCLPVWKQFKHPHLLHPSLCLLRPGSNWLITLGVRPTKREKKERERLKVCHRHHKKLPTIPMGKSQPGLAS